MDEAGPWYSTVAWHEGAPNLAAALEPSRFPSLSQEAHKAWKEQLQLQSEASQSEIPSH